MKIVALTAVLSAFSLTAAYPNRIHEGARHLEDRSHRVQLANSTTPDYPSGTASPTEDIHARHFPGSIPPLGSLVPRLHHHLTLRHHIPTGAETAPTGIVARHLGTGLSNTTATSTHTLAKRHLPVSNGTSGPAPTGIVARHLGTGLSNTTATSTQLRAKRHLPVSTETSGPAPTGIVARYLGTGIATEIRRATPTKVVARGDADAFTTIYLTFPAPRVTAQPQDGVFTISAVSTRTSLETFSGISIHRTATA
ncbi:MAG: hypothetical protein LQ342_001096 [Letrouitia transgressa]|nr:MAG: hypothetical protein LQ342_001096 [Letrouitia transgressa]